MNTFMPSTPAAVTDPDKPGWAVVVAGTSGRVWSHVRAAGDSLNLSSGSDLPAARAALAAALAFVEGEILKGRTAS
jgi:hypothetical protein